MTPPPRRRALDGCPRRYGKPLPVAGRLGLDHPACEHGQPSLDVGRDPRVQTAVGAAYLAGLFIGILPPPEKFAQSWKRDIRFTPSLDDTVRARKYAGWKDAVSRTLSK